MNFFRKLFKNRKIILGVLLLLFFLIPNFSNAQVQAGLTRAELQLLQQRHEYLFTPPNDNNYAVLTPGVPLDDYFIFKDQTAVLRTLRVIMATDDEFYNRLDVFNAEYKPNDTSEAGQEANREIATIAYRELSLIASRGLASRVNSGDSVPFGIAQTDYNRDLNHLEDLAGMENVNTDEGQRDLEKKRRNADASAIIPGAPDSMDITCDIWNFDLLSCAKRALVYLSSGVIIPFFGYILWGVSLLFNEAVFFSVTSFATTIGNLGSIQSTWAIVRDLANIFFIFIDKSRGLNRGNCL